jgi:hypothetical protein
MKPPWIIILPTAFILLALNALAMWQVIGLETLTDVAAGKSQPLGVPFNPFPSLLQSVLSILIVLSIFIWAMLLLWTKLTSALRPAVKGITVFVVAVLVASAAATASYYIDGMWSGAFRDSPTLGFPISPFVFTNALLSFATVALWVFFALSRIMRNPRQPA